MDDENTCQECDHSIHNETERYIKARMRKSIPGLFNKSMTKIPLIKLMRELCPGMGLKEAKDFVESAIDGDIAKLPYGELRYNDIEKTCTYVDATSGSRVLVCVRVEDSTRWYLDEMPSAVACDIVRAAKDRFGF